jgi:hypothetical protein
MESNSIKNAREVSGIIFQIANNSSQILFEFFYESRLIPDHINFRESQPPGVVTGHHARVSLRSYHIHT